MNDLSKASVNQDQSEVDLARFIPQVAVVDDDANGRLNLARKHAKLRWPSDKQRLRSTELRCLLLLSRAKREAEKIVTDATEEAETKASEILHTAEQEKNTAIRTTVDEAALRLNEICEELVARQHEIEAGMSAIVCDAVIRILGQLPSQVQHELVLKNALKDYAATDRLTLHASANDLQILDACVCELRKRGNTVIETTIVDENLSEGDCALSGPSGSLRIGANDQIRALFKILEKSQ